MGSDDRVRPARRPVRWWPAAAVLLVAVALLVWTWLRDAIQTQDRVLWSLSIVLIGAAALFLWLVLFSRLPGRARLVCFLGGGTLVGLGVVTLEIKGVDGNLMPIIGLRWGAETEFDAVTAEARGSTVGGPADYPQLYGPGRRASLSGPLLARDWTIDSPRELWRKPVGSACSSFAVVGDAAVTQEQRGEDEAVVRYDLRSGRQVWIHAEHAPFNTTIGGSGPRATPTIDSGTVFVLGATGILSALDLEDGARLWSRNILADHGAGQPDWGTASSPLVAGDLVVVQLGNQGLGLAAYDRLTGEPAWRAGESSGTYTSPLLATVAGVRQILVVYSDSVAGHDPITGAILWTHDWPQSGERVTPPLVLGDDRVLVSAGYGQGSRMLRLTRTDAGLAAELLWESRRLKSKFASMVFHDGVVYGLDDGVLVALDPENGERLWKGGRYGHGQLLLVGDLLLVQTEDGPVALVEATSEEHRELTRLDALHSHTWNPPALSGHLLLVRNDREAAVYELPPAPSRN